MSLEQRAREKGKGQRAKGKGKREYQESKIKFLCKLETLNFEL
jgi:hypothetical protein